MFNLCGRASVSPHRRGGVRTLGSSCRRIGKGPECGPAPAPARGTTCPLSLTTLERTWSSPRTAKEMTVLSELRSPCHGSPGQGGVLGTGGVLMRWPDNLGEGEAPGPSRPCVLSGWAGWAVRGLLTQRAASPPPQVKPATRPAPHGGPCGRGYRNGDEG